MQGLKHEKAAAQFIVDTCQRHPGKVHVLALGPLTNLALAAKLDEQLGQRLVSLAGFATSRGWSGLCFLPVCLFACHHKKIACAGCK